jgi:hypothetical protein
MTFNDAAMAFNDAASDATKRSQSFAMTRHRFADFH